VVATAIAVLGATAALAGVARALTGLGLLMVLAGAAWLTFISLFSALVQSMAPDWVRARVSAVFMLVFQGGLAAGSALWGLVGERAPAFRPRSPWRVSPASPRPQSDGDGGCPQPWETSARGITGGYRRW
jgi:hypothetical protein